DHLVEALQPPRSAAYNPLFQVMCNVQRWEFQQTRQLAGMTVEYIANDARFVEQVAAVGQAAAEALVEV
ncbi:hypothetical protein ACV35Z_38390, partial [Pseudomonas aeruginosa]